MSAPQAALLGQDSAHDASFSSVVQLAHFNGAPGSTTFTNSCPRGNTLAQNNAGATISGTQFKFGGSSMYSSTGDLHAASSADYNMGSGDFTIEWWQRLDGIGAGVTQVLVDMRPTGTTGNYPVLVTPGSGTLNYSVNATTRITAAAAIAATTWQFITLCKVSGNTRLFVNGTQVGSTFVDGITYAQGHIYVANGAFGGAQAPGYFAELRITNGVGRYSGNFTAPTAPFPNH